MYAIVTTKSYIEFLIVVDSVKTTLLFSYCLLTTTGRGWGNKTKLNPTPCQDLMQIRHTQRSVLTLELSEGDDGLFVVVLEDHGAVALAAVVAVLHDGHEHAGAALLARALAPQPVDLAVLVHLRNPEAP